MLILLRKSQALTDGAVPHSLMTDFEIGAINAFSDVYSNMNQFGCHFHLSQSIQRHVREQGLTQLYMNDPVFRENVKMISALAFVPVQNVVGDFTTWVGHCRVNEQHILDYFENTYIGQPLRGRRNAPLFAPDFWNVTARVLNGLPRTTNAVEGWYNKFNRCVSASHPSVWKLIEAMRGDSAANHLSIAQEINGQLPPAQKRRYVQVNNNISNLVATYANRDIIHFLRCISYNLAN